MCEELCFLAGDLEHLSQPGDGSGLDNFSGEKNGLGNV